MADIPRRRNPNAGGSDIERFLAEVDRLRRKAATPAPAPAFDDEEVVDVLPADAPPPPVRPRPAAPARPGPADVVDVVDVLPVRTQMPPAPPALPALPVAPAPAPPANLPGLPGAAPLAKLASPIFSGQQQSGRTHPVVALLKKNNIREVFALRELLDVPVSRRRRR